MKNYCFLCVNERVAKDFLLCQMSALKSEGYEIHLITRFSDVHLFENSGVCICHNVDIPRGPSPFKILKCIFAVKKYLKRNNIDAIQYTGPTTSLISSLAGKMAGIKARIYCQWGLRFEGFSGLKRRIYRAIEKFTCKLSSVVFIDSKLNCEMEIKNHIVKRDKAFIIHNGSTNGIDFNLVNSIDKSKAANLFRQKYEIKKDTFIVGFLGRVAHDKGIDDLLEAILIVKDSYDIYFVIAGFEDENDPIDQNLKKEAISLGNVLFTGRIDNPEETISCFDLFVFPSYREGYGGGCLLAGALSIPVIGSNIPPIFESLNNGEFGTTVDIKSPTILADKIIDCYKNKKTISRNAVCYQKWVSDNFNRNDWLKAYVKNINNVISRFEK